MYACGEMLLRLQEDAGKAQDAATAVASLESELEQATRREEQLRASRAQCEYQLQQAGEVAQSQVTSTLHIIIACLPNVTQLNSPHRSILAVTKFCCFKMLLSEQQHQGELSRQN